MILLDTDHLSLLKYHDSDRQRRLVARITLAAGQTFGVTIISVEEQMRGWLAAIALQKQVRRQVSAYRELGRLFDFFRPFTLASFDNAAVERFELLRSGGVRIGTMDLKIASIVLSLDALLLTANRQDFGQVPGLRFENWMDD